MIERRLDCGLWRQLDYHVFAIQGAPSTWRQRLMAALLSRPLAYATGRSAAHLHGFPGYKPSRPEILVPFPGNARSPLARVIRARQFEKVAVDRLDGISATTVAETILVLGYREPTPVIERLVDDRLAARVLRIEDFDQILDRLAGARVRGLAGLRRIVAARDEGAYQPPNTELERLLYALLEDPEVPAHTRQAPLALPERFSTVDAFIPSWGLIVEADGRRWHTRSKDFELDRARDNASAAAGYLTLRFTYSMLTKDLQGCIHTLLKTGRLREAR
jgi:very-short-patch-repair endonuclease